MTTKFPSSPVSSRAARLFCRGSTASRNVHHHQAVLFWLKSIRSACSRSFGPSADLPSARAQGACTCRPTSAFSASSFFARSGSGKACSGGCARASRPGCARWKPGRPGGGRRTSSCVSKPPRSWKAMACVTSRSRCLASWYSLRGSLTARSLSASS